LSKKTIEELGEFGLIDHLGRSFVNIRPSTKKGIGDDAAVISIPQQDEQLLVSTDMLVEGVHFNLMYVPLKHLGYKAVVVNLSDICAMNARPEQILVSIAFSSKFPIKAIEELYIGIQRACEVYGVDLVGGDTSTSYTGLTISITAIGRAERNKITYRSGAKEHDLIVVSGDLGGAYMGLQVLEREKDVFRASPNIQPDLQGYDQVVRKQLKPEARMDVVSFLEELNVVPTSMIDISDGLSSELLHLCKNSEVGCRIYDEKIPIDHTTSLAAIDFNLDPIICALHGGEDYELLFTIDQECFEKINTNPHFSIIGHIVSKEEGTYYIGKNNSAISLTAQGWRHFS